MLDDEQRVTGAVVVVSDIDALKRATERQTTLTAELQHRVRNILASIRAIVGRAGGDGEAVEKFRSHLEGRIAALARTQGVLTQSPGEGADLEMIVRDELLAQVADETQFTITGPDLRLSLKAAEIVTLAIHELATNATKYGALSNDRGSIRIEWRKIPREDEVWVTLGWSETGITMDASVPPRGGFGTELITRRVPYELQGTGTMTFAKNGLHAEITFPLQGGEAS